MKTAKEKNRYADIVIAVIATLLLVIIASVAYDHYYEFNDDVLMKDILSGTYTGTPSALNVQMLSPIGFFISFLYRLAPGIPWYALFLCGCQYLCILIITYRIVHLTPDLSGGIAAGAIVFLFAMCSLLPHLTMVQYTVTVAIIAATAALYLYTIPVDVTGRRFVVKALPAIVMVILAFQIRTEMLLLLAPFLAICGLARWSREKHPFDHSTVRGFLGVIILIVVGMAASFFINSVSYSSGEWKVFLMEFDNRTELYDYQYVPPYDEQSGFYESIDMTASQVKLLENYDYALDDRIDGERIGQVAFFASQLRHESVRDRLHEAFREYIYRVTHFKGGAYSLLVLFLYVMLVISVLSSRERSTGRKIMIMLLRVGGLLIMRSISWMYIIYGRRLPDRIVHPLYIIECVMLFAMISAEFSGRIKDGRYLRMTTGIVLIVGGLIVLPGSVAKLNSRMAVQKDVNALGDAIDAYCREHPDNFYFEDVYSTIIDGETFNERMFADNEPYVKNYDLIGGWISNSPLFREKLAGWGITDVSDAILENDNVFIICSDEYDMDWVSDHYADTGTAVKIELIDGIAGHFGVYSVRRAY
ncbi:hypothetical protein SAMN02910292_00993 [Lachnospiraceae bacterium XBB2008]|nr:hypothetical protein SAMN02910292_00993 [Lachnospiraceae bacterium XBB2008]